MNMVSGLAFAKKYRTGKLQTQFNSLTAQRGKLIPFLIKIKKLEKSVDKVVIK
jgi:hypothetical protein